MALVDSAHTILPPLGLHRHLVRELLPRRVRYQPQCLGLPRSLLLLLVLHSFLAVLFRACDLCQVGLCWGLRGSSTLSAHTLPCESQGLTFSIVVLRLLLNPVRVLDPRIHDLNIAVSSERGPLSTLQVDNVSAIAAEYHVISFVTNLADGC